MPMPRALSLYCPRPCWYTPGRAWLAALSACGSGSSPPATGACAPGRGGGCWCASLGTHGRCRRGRTRPADAPHAARASQPLVMCWVVADLLSNQPFALRLLHRHPHGRAPTAPSIPSAPPIHKFSGIGKAACAQPTAGQRLAARVCIRHRPEHIASRKLHRAIGATLRRHDSLRVGLPNLGICQAMAIPAPRHALSCLHCLRRPGLRFGRVAAGARLRRSCGCARFRTQRNAGRGGGRGAPAGAHQGTHAAHRLRGALYCCWLRWVLLEAHGLNL